jgi:hypothetical protein
MRARAYPPSPARIARELNNADPPSNARLRLICMEQDRGKLNRHPFEDRQEHRATRKWIDRQHRLFELQNSGALCISSKKRRLDIVSE